jgi:hypothetical protein
MIEKNLPFVEDATSSLPADKLVKASGEQFLGISYVLEATLHPEMADKVDALDASIKKVLNPPQE